MFGDRHRDGLAYLNEGSGLLLISSNSLLVTTILDAYDVRRHDHIEATSKRTTLLDLAESIYRERVPTLGVSAIDHLHAPRSSIAKVKSFDAVPYKFRLLVQVRDCIPSRKNIIQMTRRVGNSDVYEYVCELTLQDEDNDTINVYLCGKNAEKFFYGIPPVNLRENAKA